MGTAKLLAFSVSVIGGKCTIAMLTHLLLQGFHDLTPPSHLSNNKENFGRKWKKKGVNLTGEKKTLQEEKNIFKAP
jgi:hypothetical protein